MRSISLSAALAVFISCALKPGLAGIPSAVFIFKFSFVETLLIAGGGGLSGVFFFTFLIGEIIRIFSKLKSKFTSTDQIKKSKTFTKKNRIIIHAKKKFGIAGIALVSPVFLSIPLGIFLSLRFFQDKTRTLKWMSASVVFWTVVLFFLYNSFTTFFEKFFTS